MERVSLQIPETEFFSLLEPSGCGKTTTLRIIAGFERPDSGELFLAGKPALTILPHERDVNLVFQSYALFPHLTVARNVAFGLEMQHRPRAEIQRRVGEVQELVRLTGLEDRYPKQLSGGQQQRVALARALGVSSRNLSLSGALLAFTLSLDDFYITYFSTTGGTGFQTLPKTGTGEPLRELSRGLLVFE